MKDPDRLILAVNEKYKMLTSNQKKSIPRSYFFSVLPAKKFKAYRYSYRPSSILCIEMQMRIERRIDSRVLMFLDF